MDSASDAAMSNIVVLACIVDAVLPVSPVFDSIGEIVIRGIEHCDPLVLTCASSLSNLPVESSSMDIVILIWQYLECPPDHLVQEILRVLKVGGSTLIRKPSQSALGSVDKMMSDLEHKLPLAGFSETQILQLKPTISSEIKPSGIKAKKLSWKIGSSFALKKAVKIIS
ncbi:hypothetical protein QN277_013734 [Acacia crassicarpa]|uniref:Methyltransferase type 11 domain-containing protein n=1 Tax=Acacia crassicarpa TaxID=499986 RepID=A0AAE1TEG9_9FABA|nr:hypothetical protein QN277_013734 [Acacia crassicarpa]